MDKYSDKYSHLQDDDTCMYRQQLLQYREFLYKGEIHLVQLPTNNVGICTTVYIPAGSNSILIQREPIVIEICGKNLEFCELKVYPDRTNFPYEYFPHVNFPVGNMPPTICLTRENFIDWYAEHTFPEFLCLISKWYKDALTGNLIKINGKDYFEPFRPQNTNIHLFRYPYEDSLNENLIEPRNSVFAIENLGSDIYKSDILNKNFTTHNSEIGILLARPSNEICKSWFIKRPKTICELLSFGIENHFLLDLDILKCALQKNNNANDIFVHMAFPRPLMVLGKSSRFDYLTFRLKARDVKSDNLEGLVTEVLVYDLTNIDKARYHSATKKSIFDKKILILGCGAIGSKLCYHLYRAGICNITICDNDIMQSHNVCRHALAHSDFFKKKVDLVKTELNQMFYDCRKIETVDANILQWLPCQDLSQFDLIIDATASASVFRFVDEMSKSSNIPFIRFSLSDAGKVGLVYSNFNRTSLLSDYYMYLVSLAICKDENDIHEWIVNESKYNFDLVRIGEGCHSNTMILSDDIISTHTSIASNVIRNIFEGNTHNQAYLSYVNTEYIGQVFTEKYQIPEFKSFRCENDNDWQVRIPLNLLDFIELSAKKSKNKEVGGYMMGVIDEKRKIIYVLHQFIPNDSVKHQTNLHLGKKGWKEEYKHVLDRTSNIINYIGDWHSHPIGSLEMSITDVLTNIAIKETEIVFNYGLCLITNGNSTKAHLIRSNY